jgi:hypothetical protein
VRLYCVLSWITTRKKVRGTYGPQILMENSERKIEHYTKLKPARSAFEYRARELNSEMGTCFRNETRTAHVKLFVPHVDPENGHLMDWPSKKYIAEFEKSDSEG